MNEARILIVEDETVAARDIRRRLNSLGYEVVGISATAEAAVRAARRNAPDLVLMDIKLQGDKDGVDAAGEILSVMDTGIVYLTANVTKALVERAKATAPEAYLSKPVTTEELHATIETALNRRNMMRRIKESEEKYRLIFENIQDVYYESSFEGVILEVSPSVEKELGIKREAVIGCSTLEFHVTPEQRARSVQILLEKGVIRDQEILVKDGSGRFTPCSLTCSLSRDAQGRPWKICGSVRVITERVKMEAESRRAREEWERTFDAMPDLVAILDADQHIIRCNRAMQDALGSNVGDLAGTKCFHCVHDSEAPPSFCPYRSAKRDGAVHSAEIFIERLQKYFLVTVAPFTDKGGTPAGCVHIARDITELKKLGKQLEVKMEEATSTNAELQALLDCSKGLMVLKNFEDQAHTIFNAAKRITGAEAGYVALLSPDGEENHVVFPDPGFLICTVDPWLPMPVKGLRDDAYRTGKTVYENDFSSSRWMRHVDEGHLALRNALFAPLMIEGKAEGLLGLANVKGGFTEEHARLVTAFAEFAAIGLKNSRTERALRESEEKFRTLVEQLPTIAYSAGLKEGSPTMYVSPQIETHLGIPPQVWVNDPLAWFEGIHPEDKARVSAELAEANAGSIPFASEYRMISASGETVWFRDQAVVVADPTGKPLFRRGVMVNISDRKRAEDLLVESERLKAVEDLSAGVSHNFNNMLQIIMGNAQFAGLSLDRGDMDELRRCLSEIDKASTFAASTVKRLQDFAFSRPVASLPEVFDLCETIRHAVSMSRIWWDRTPRKGSPTVEVVEDLLGPCPVRGKEHELFEVFTNLLKNAAEALVQGGSIRVSARTRDSRVIATVADTGPGIPPEHISKVFEPFFTTKGYNRTGMGLPSSYGIVRSHGGSLTTQSVSGEGAMFLVSLPTETSGPAADPKPVHLKVPSRKRVVLVIDDMTSVLSMLRAFLTKQGYDTKTSASGEEGVRIWETSPVDVILCDLGMPGMNGYDVAEHVQRVCREKGIPKTPFILLTGWGDLSEEGRKIKEAGIDVVVPKPVDFQKLIRILEESIPRGPGSD